MKFLTAMIGVIVGLTPFSLNALGVTHTPESALLPEGKVASTITSADPPVVSFYPPNEQIQIGTGTVTAYDGYLDPTEWAKATLVVITDTCGQSDGLPNPLGTTHLYLMQDDVQVYFGIDAICDIYEDWYDQCGLYFDDNDDGCFPQSATHEGNIWLVDDLAGGFCLWRWCQDQDECIPEEGICMGNNWGDSYEIDPCGLGISTISGHMQYEVGINFGEFADEDYEIQTRFTQGETCGFYIYCLDQYYYDFIGDFPCPGVSNISAQPCFWVSLYGSKQGFSYSMDVFQTQVPIGGSLDFAKHFHNNTCQIMTIYDTVYAYKGSNLKKKFSYEWTIECEQDLDVCFALKVPEKDQFICWEITIVNSGVAVAGGDEYSFEESFDVHIEPGHMSEVECP